MNAHKGPRDSFENNLATESAALIEAVEGMGDSKEARNIDLSDVTEDENRIRFILLKDEAAKALSNLFESQYNHRADICSKFNEYSSQVLGRRQYKLMLTEVYKAALASDEDSTSIYLMQMLDEIKKEFVQQTGEELPRSVDDVRLGVRAKLQVDGATRARLGAGEKWAGLRLAQTTDNPSPMHRSEGGGGTSRHQEEDWAA